jgi:hypothetical protein
MRADNTHHLLAAARQRAVETRRRAVAALRRLDAIGQPVSFDAVAREAAVSRSWLYAQPDLRIEIGRLRAQQGRVPSSPPIPARQRASEASLRRRLEAVNAEIRRLQEENQRLREQLAWAHGELRAADVCGPMGGGALKRGRPSTIGPCS